MEIKGTTRVCGLIGDPVHHTLSPTIHNTLAAELGTDLVYVPFEVKKDALCDAIKGAAALDILGMNVTIPHKNAVIPFLTDIDPAASGIGAVNTLVRKDGGFKGYNTDYYGIKRSLERAGASLKGESVIILGAGGVSRPAAFLCAAEGAREIYILNRTLANAEGLAGAVNEFAGRELASAMELSDYGKLPKDRKYLCFQMTSVGLYPENDRAVIDDPGFYSLIHTGFDAVYRPLNTRFLKNCAAAGAACIDGLRVLLYQGVEAYELWNGIKVSESLSEKVYGRLLGSLLEGKNIVLTGFMGSGKSAVSKHLSGLLGYEFLDTDALIEEREGRSISRIFEESGEEYFRDLETTVVKELSQNSTNLVLSVGGGLPLREENRKLLKDIGTVVYLRTRPETVYERIKHDTSRPLLQTEDVPGTIKRMQDERKSFYEDGADLILDTDDRTVEQIGTDILNRIL